MNPIFIPVKPMPAPRPRAGKGKDGKGVVHNPKAYMVWKQQLATILRPHFRNPIEGPVTLEVDFYFQYPKSWSRKKKETTVFHTSVPDLDNLVKAVKDSLNGIAYKDDSQVCRSESNKYYSERMGIALRITPRSVHSV